MGTTVQGVAAVGGATAPKGPKENASPEFLGVALELDTYSWERYTKPIGRRPHPPKYPIASGNGKDIQNVFQFYSNSYQRAGELLKTLEANRSDPRLGEPEVGALGLDATKTWVKRDLAERGKSKAKIEVVESRRYPLLLKGGTESSSKDLQVGYLSVMKLKAAGRTYEISKLHRYTVTEPWRGKQLQHLTESDIEIKNVAAR